MHILTANNQFGYKEGLSTTDAIQKVEEYINKATPDSHIILMDLSKAFDTINRPLLWTALYKKGIPIEMIKQIWRGHQNTQLMAKTNNQYGPKVINNVGVFQGSAISALLFIIYLDDVMGDYNALNANKQIATKQTYERCEQENKCK